MNGISGISESKQTGMFASMIWIHLIIQHDSRGREILSVRKEIKVFYLLLIWLVGKDEN